MMYDEDLLPKRSSKGASGAVLYGNALPLINVMPFFILPNP